MTFDMAWQLPLTRLLRAQHRATLFHTPVAMRRPAGYFTRSRSRSMLPAPRVSVPAGSELAARIHYSPSPPVPPAASDEDEELAFSFGFADLKHGRVIHSGVNAQVKEVRISKSDTCRLHLTSVFLCPIFFTAGKRCLHGVGLMLCGWFDSAMASLLISLLACRASCWVAR